MQIINDAVIANAAAPRRGLSSETLDISVERIFLHSEQSSSNVCLIFLRQSLEVFLRGSR